MSAINAVFFWFSGVIIQPLHTLLFHALQSRGNQTNLLMQSEYFTLCDALATGALDAAAFCRRLAQICALDVDSATLEKEILAAAEPNPGVNAEIDKLPREYQRWLVVDLPAHWFEQLAGRIEVSSCFSPQEIVFLPHAGLPRLVPEAFDYLARCARTSRGKCLLFHASTHHAIEALNYGMHAATFVDARHIEREFLLRRITDKAYRVH
ncbi:MAG: hypothetical protein HPY45_07195 [Anaerolineae bacterium]|nr:hypothetical protein [Anaerolineae bacterium]